MTIAPTVTIASVLTNVPPKNTSEHVHASNVVVVRNDDMSFLLSRGGRKGPIICFAGLLLIFALYQLGIICGSMKYVPTAMMVAKEVSPR